MNTSKIGPFLGLNTRRPDFSLKTDQGHYLRSAVNIDVTNTGDIVRRRGCAKIQSMTNAHSLKMTSDTTGFVVRSLVLYAITLPTYTETIVTTLTSNNPMNYVQVGADWYYSNGVDIGRVLSGVAYPIGLSPISPPTLTTIAGGLLAGQYQVGLTYYNSVTGEEGAFMNLAYKELTATGGIRVPLPGASFGATHVNVYMSERNGTIQHLHSSVPASTSSIDLTALATGRIAASRNEGLLPAGTLFYTNGRLCSFSGNTVYIGMPFRYGYYLPLSGFIPFPEDVSIAIANESGVYIAADKTYFIPGDIVSSEETIRDVLPYGAVKGTAFTAPNKKTIGWFGKKGFVLAETDGSINTSMSDNIDVSPPASGMSNVTESDGMRKVTSCGYSMNLDNLAVTTYSDWAFTSVSKNYGTKADGIYRLDTADAVAATVGLGKQDFGSELLKTMPAAYIGCSSSAPMTLRVKTPSMDYSYNARGFSTSVQQNRVDAGKGLRSNWFDLEVSNSSGCDFTLASISFAELATVRRI